MEYKFEIGNIVKVVSSGDESYLKHFLQIGDIVEIATTFDGWKEPAYYVRKSDGKKYSEPILERELQWCDGLLFDSFERNVIVKYSGKWGFECPDYAPPIVRRYNILKIKKEFTRILKLKQIVEWLHRH